VYRIDSCGIGICLNTVGILKADKPTTVEEFRGISTYAMSGNCLVFATLTCSLNVTFTDVLGTTLSKVFNSEVRGKVEWFSDCAL